MVQTIQRAALQAQQPAWGRDAGPTGFGDDSERGVHGKFGRMAHDAVWREGSSRLLRFRSQSGPRQRGSVSGPVSGLAPVLLVPSMLQRWHIFDLVSYSSIARALVDAGLDVYCLDWGDVDQERLLGWWDAVGRLRRGREATLRASGADRVSIVGYSQGGTLATTEVALRPEGAAALVNIAGPIDFSKAGTFGRLVDARWLNADLIADAGGLPPWVFRMTVAALHPWLPLRGFVLGALHPDRRARETWLALELWANDAAGVPPEVLRTWLRELYQQNALVRGAFGQEEVVRLAAIGCPVMTITADRDSLCPREAAEALNDHVGSSVRATLRVPGGHVSGMVGPGAVEAVHRPLAAWLVER